jgi:hypothetical protein
MTVSASASPNALRTRQTESELSDEKVGFATISRPTMNTALPKGVTWEATTTPIKPIQLRAWPLLLLSTDARG